MSDINDLIGLAIDKNPVDFAKAFDEIMAGKVATALEARSIDIASSLYAEEKDEEELDVEEFDFDGDDLDTDLDEDLDLDDLDLSDLDDEFEDNGDGEDA